MWRSVLWMGVLLMGTLGGESLAVVTVSDPGTQVVDQAHLLSAQESQQIEGWLDELFEKTRAQVKLLTVSSMDGEDVVSFSQRHYELWKLGSRERSDGALVVVALLDRKVRVHTGYGLEGALPDSWCGSTCREIARDYFKGGRYGPGLVELAARVARQVADEQHVQLTGVPKGHPPQNPEDESWNWMLILILLMFVLPTLAEYFRLRMHRRYPRSWLFRQTWLNSGGGGRFGGGGSGGGSFGGGSFGGGGSSGGGGGGASW